MTNGIWVVFKKEMSHFFGDKRLFFTSVIMPGLLIYVLYTIMGSYMSSMIKEETESFKTAAVNMPQTVELALLEYNFEIEHIDRNDIEKAKQGISDGDYAIVAVFPDDFETALSNYTPDESNGSVPNVEIYYKSVNSNSSIAYMDLVSVLDAMEDQLNNVFDVNNNENSDITYDLATKQDATGNTIGMLLPMLLMTLMYSSCASLAPESIAGEKERGTICALLITPVPRSHIIMGKLASLSLMALMGGVSSFLGIILSMPSLMSSMNMAGASDLISADVYRPSDYIWLMVLIITTVLLMVTLISILSTLAHSVKEAGTLVMPLMMAVMLSSFASMGMSSGEVPTAAYLIPLYGTSASFSGIFTFSMNPLCVLLNVCSNVVLSGIGVFVLTKLFNNEKVMFNG